MTVNNNNQVSTIKHHKSLSPILLPKHQMVFYAHLAFKRERNENTSFTMAFTPTWLSNSLLSLLQKAPSAAARLANLPVVRSACARLSVLYTGTKSRHPGLKSACEVLESSVTAVGRAACYRASPVIVKLEPQSK